MLVVSHLGNQMKEMFLDQILETLLILKMRAISEGVYQRDSDLSNRTDSTGKGPADMNIETTKRPG